MYPLIINLYFVTSKLKCGPYSCFQRNTDMVWSCQSRSINFVSHSTLCCASYCQTKGL